MERRLSLAARWTARQARRAYPPGRSRSGWRPVRCASPPDAWPPPGTAVLSPTSRAERAATGSRERLPGDRLLARTQREARSGSPRSRRRQLHLGDGLGACHMDSQPAYRQVSGLSGCPHTGQGVHANLISLIISARTRLGHLALRSSAARPRNRNTTRCVNSGCGSARAPARRRASRSREARPGGTPGRIDVEPGASPRPGHHPGEVLRGVAVRNRRTLREGAVRFETPAPGRPPCGCPDHCIQEG